MKPLGATITLDGITALKTRTTKLVRSCRARLLLILVTCGCWCRVPSFTSTQWWFLTPHLLLLSIRVWFSTPVTGGLPGEWWHSSCIVAPIWGHFHYKIALFPLNVITHDCNNDRLMPYGPIACPVEQMRSSPRHVCLPPRQVSALQRPCL